MSNNCWLGGGAGSGRELLYFFFGCGEDGIRAFFVLLFTFCIFFALRNIALFVFQNNLCKVSCHFPKNQNYLP